MTDHVRHVGIFIEELDPGAFHWVLVENVRDAAVWVDQGRSPAPFDNWPAAWDAACVARQQFVDAERIDPR